MARLVPGQMESTRAKMPATFGAYRRMGRSLLVEGTLGTALKEMLRLKSAELAHCRH